MITERKVLIEVSKYKAIERPLSIAQRKKDYQGLVDKYGLDLVILASGLSRGTLIQYLNASTTVIGYEQLAQAKAVFGKLSKSE